MAAERDKRTDGQTDGHRATAKVALMHSIKRQKSNISLYFKNETRYGHIVTMDCE